MEHGRGASQSMIRTTPFHERTSALNETGLWEHWSSHLAAVRYQMSEKFEYFAIRNAAGLFDTSPLYKYRFTGPDAGALPRRRARPRPGASASSGKAQYTLWCDDRGFVIEDGVLLHVAENEYLLTAAEPNLAYFAVAHRARWTSRSRTSRATGGSCPSRARARATSSPRSRRRRRTSATSTSRPAKLAGVPVLLSRTGYTGDLGFEIWVPAADALKVWDAVWKVSRGQGVIPFGMTALYMARIEAGLVLLDVDFHSSRFAWTDADRSTPIELGLGWMFRDLAPARRTAPAPPRRSATARTATTGRSSARDAIRRELADKTSRWQLTGLVVDWRDYDRIYDERGPDPAQGPHAAPGRVLRLRRRAQPARLRDEPDVLADAPAPHRARPRPARPDGARLTRQAGDGREPPLRVLRRARDAPAPVQPTTKDGLTMAKTNGTKASNARRARAEALGTGALDARGANLRRDRRRRGPQRDDERGLPREGRPADARARAPRQRRRRGDHRGAPARASGSRRSRTR